MLSDSESMGSLTIRAGQVVLPLTDRLRADADALGKLLLRHAEALAVVLDAFPDGGLIHIGSLLFICPHYRCAGRKSLSSVG